MQSSTTRALANPYTGLISVTGRDAESFLHAQLSRHIQGLAEELAPLAGWHDARGRLRALFRVLRTDQGFLLLTDADVVAAAVRGLQLFVLRADVTLADESDHWRVLSVTGNGLPAALSPGTPSGSVRRHGQVHAIRLGPTLIQVVGPVHATGQWLDAAGLAAPDPDDTAAVLAGIRLGLPVLPATLAGRFLPQMLNLDRFDAVSFDKGCFPGQEVIARAQNLGQVKRRMALFSAATVQAPAPGTEILDGTGRAAGEVVRAVRAGEHVELLAVVPTSAGAHLWLAATQTPGTQATQARIALHPLQADSTATSEP